MKTYNIFEINSAQVQKKTFCHKLILMMLTSGIIIFTIIFITKINYKLNNYFQTNYYPQQMAVLPHFNHPRKLRDHQVLLKR